MTFPPAGGTVQVTINREQKIRVPAGLTLLMALAEKGFFIPSACGGQGLCGYCKVEMIENPAPPTLIEKSRLKQEEIDRGIRLACQLRVDRDIRIRIPERVLPFRLYDSTCSQITDLTSDIKQIRLVLREPASLRFTPGQYIQLFKPSTPKSPEKVFRAYSIASDPELKNRIDLIIRRAPAGLCTEYIFEQLRVGDAVRFHGPYGRFRLSGTDAPTLMIAGGSGLAPIQSMLHHLKNTGSRRKTIFFFGVNTLQDLYHLDQMQEFESRLPDFQFVPVVARPEESGHWTGKRGLVTEALSESLQDASGFEAYLCGSPGMIDASIAVLKELGMKEEKIYYDKFS